ncbi:phosphatidylethanolamine-binding protein (PEBP) family uncharacterized protein [Arthrobacter sp. UYEF6]
MASDAGFRRFVGAAPPTGHGVHRYHVVVHALEKKNLDMPVESSPACLGFNLFPHVTGRARLVGVFEQP